MKEGIPDKLYFKIGEASKLTGVEPYILRYWESEFKVIKPVRTKSNQRLYRRKDIELILEIKTMLYNELFTIAGAKKRLEENARSARKGRQSLGSDEGKTPQELLAVVKEELKEIRRLLGRGR
jgi:DNA-binding transcriptional MerR regulator